MTIGIRPTHPETGYGYIQFDADGEIDGVRDDGPDEAPRAHRVRTFAEKPDLATAERFLDSGDFLWNSGMFVWRARAVLDAMDLEERMTVCNMSIEGGARCGYVNPDARTIEYLRGKAAVPSGEEFERAAAWWLSLASGLPKDISVTTPKKRFLLP